MKLILSINYQLDIPFFYILKASPIPTILDHSDHSCLWVLLGSFPTGPQFTTFLLPGVYEARLFSLSLLLSAHSMPPITLLSLDNCSSYLTDLFAALSTLSSKDKKPVYPWVCPCSQMQSLMEIRRYEVSSLAWAIGKWLPSSALSFFLSVQWGWCLLLAIWACAVFLSHLPAASLPILVLPFLSQDKYHFFRTSTLLPWSWPKTYYIHFFFFIVLYVCVTSFLIL